MKKKGFTLVELIAVIVVLAILSLITVPIVFNQIESTRIESYKVSVRNVINAVSSYMAKNEGVDNFPNEGLIIPTSEYYKRLSLKNANFKSGRIFLNEEGVLVAKEVSDGTFCASGTKNDLKVIKGECEFIDDTKPEINVMVNRVTTTSITVSVNSFDNESGITDYKYYLNGKLIAGTKNNVYTFKNLKPNTEYEIKVVTVNGNNLEAEQTLNVTTVTREILIEAKPEGWSHSKTVTITFSKETGYETYRYKKVGDINWISVAGNKVDFLIEQNCTIIAQILSANGEVIIEVTKAIGSIDNDKPQIIGISGNDEVWGLSKRIKINATDGLGSGIDSYSFDGGNTWQKSNAKVITEKQTINVAAKDKLGNISDVKTYDILYIDNTIPKAHSITASTSDGVYTSNKWTNKTVTLTANPNPTETASGYTYQWYEKTGSNYVAIKGATNKTLVLDSETTKSYRVDVLTIAGGGPTPSSNTYTVKIDKTPPSCNMQEAYTTWTKENRTLTATCSDSASGCNTSSKVWEYKESNSEIKTETLTYIVRDNVGNSKTCTYNDYGIYVDKKSPTLSLKTVTKTTNSATIPYVASDGGSGVTKATCVYGLSTSYGSTGTVNSSNNGCTLSKLKNDTTYYYKICVSDKVGNTATCETGNIKTAAIEKPSIISETNPTTAQNGHVKQQVAKVTYVGTGLTSPRYFVKTTIAGTSSITVTKSCGTGTSPNPSCTTITSTKSLAANTWYEVSGNVNVTYNTSSSTNGTIYATTYDGVSFVNPFVTQTLLKIDTTSPTVTINSTSSTGNSITVNYTLDDKESGIGIYTCKYTTGSDNPFVSSGNSSYDSNASNVSATSCTITGLSSYAEYYYQICATDKVGNITKCQTGVEKTKDITKPTKPTITAVLNGTSTAYSSGSWTNKSVKISVSSTDSQSKIAKIQYRHSDSDWMEDWGSSLTASGNTASIFGVWNNERNTTVYVRAIDNAGNISETNSISLKIDKTAPTCGTYSGGSTTWTNQNRTISVTCSDKGGAGCASTSFSKTFSSTIKTSGAGITIKDGAGNTTSCNATQNIYVDKDTPSISSYKGASTKWSNSNRSWAIEPAPSASGVTNLYYYTSNITDAPSTSTTGTQCSSTTSCSVPAGKYVFFRVKNQAGTYSGWSKAKNNYVDKTAPTCTSSGGSTSWTSTSRTITGTCSDTGGSECTGNATKTYSTNTNTTTASPGKVYDNAGNSVDCPANQTVRVDTTNPTVTINSHSATTNSITVNYTLSDSPSGIGNLTCKYVDASTAVSVSAEDATYTNSVSSASKTSCTITGLKSNTKYHVKICATDNAARTTCQYVTKTTNKEPTTPPTKTCTWSASMYRASSSATEITISFTPSNNCTFNKIDVSKVTATYTIAGGETKQYPMFQCGYYTPSNGGWPVAHECSPSPIAQFITKTPSNYVYKISEIKDPSNIAVHLKFTATFDNSAQSSVSYTISGCTACDPTNNTVKTSCYKNVGFKWTLCNS